MTADVESPAPPAPARAEPSRRVEARALDAAVTALVARGWADPPGEAEVDELGARLFRHQARHNPVAAAWWGGLAREPAAVRGWRDVPPLPVAAFKWLRVAAFPAPPGEEPTFLSSGTTSAARSRVHVEDPALYETALTASFRRHALPDRERMRLLFLAPEPGARRSSLLHMFAVLRERFGAAGSAFLGTDAGVPGEPLAARLERACVEGEPVLLLGAAFAFVHALDALRRDGSRFELPPGSRIFQTGGFKGRSREVSPAELRAGYAERLGVAAGGVLHEYGMAELASQFYAREDAPYVAPPWVRWRVLRPLTLEPAEEGEPGVLAVWDLANRSTCFALRTEDLAVARRGGFELLGRIPGGDARGCSLEADRGDGG